MSKYSHSVLTPRALRKRKEREGLDGVTTATVASQAQPLPDNRLLAGYLAHEFLTKGTLFGKKWDPARADPAHEPSKPRIDKKPIASSQIQAEMGAKHGAYADVAHLLKTDGTHIPGIVNPTQLGRWIQM